jgi:hypothetical protein
MASERQIAANRRNAQKSTGPKSKSGKKLSSMNALRHGLSVPMSTEGAEALLKKLMRQFALGASDEGNLALAERAAGAQLELARVRRVENEMIERALTVFAGDAGRCDPDPEEARHRIAQNWRQAIKRGRLSKPKLLDHLVPLPGGKEEEEQRFLNAVRSILPELTRISRYEKRAAGQRDRAISKSMKSRGQRNRNRSV